MAKVKDRALAIGIASLVFSILSFLLGLWLVPAERWGPVVAGISPEGLSLLALWIGLSLISVSVVPRISSRVSALFARRRESRIQKEKDRGEQMRLSLIFAHLDYEDREKLRALLHGPRRLNRPPPRGFAFALPLQDDPPLYFLQPLAVEPVRQSLLDFDRELRARQFATASSYLSSAGEDDREVLRAFADSAIMEPAEVYSQAPLIVALRNLEKNHVVSVEWKTWRNHPIAMELNDYSVALVEGLVLKKKVIRTRVIIATD